MPDAVRVVVAGVAAGRVVALDDALSFWGGFDYDTGEVIDERHPQVGVDISGAIVTMAVGRGSSSASSVLAEAIRRGTAPAALVMREVDEIIALGSIVAGELYQSPIPILVVDKTTFGRVAAATTATIAVDGTIALA